MAVGLVSFDRGFKRKEGLPMDVQICVPNISLKFDKERFMAENAIKAGEVRICPGA